MVASAMLVPPAASRGQEAASPRSPSSLHSSSWPAKGTHGFVPFTASVQLCELTREDETVPVALGDVVPSLDQDSQGQDERCPFIDGLAQNCIAALESPLVVFWPSCVLIS